MRNSFTKHSFVAVAVLAAFQFLACTQPANPSQANNSPIDQVNEKSKPVIPRDILTHQPDFTAEEVFSEFEPRVHGGFSLVTKIAKKGNCYRSELDGDVDYFRPNMPIVSYHPKRKRYTEIPPSDDSKWHLNINYVEIFASEENIQFEELGTQVVQGHECIKIKASTKGTSSQDRDETALFYAAKDLRNLVIAIEVNLSDRTDRYILRNISFAVPDKLFAPIENYKPNRV